MAGPSPRIVDYTQQIEPDIRGVTIPHASSPSVYNSAIGEGFRDLSQGLSTLGEGIIRTQEEQARAWSANALSKMRLDWTEHFHQRKESAEPGAPSFTPNLLKDYDEASAEVVSKAPTNKASRYINERLNAFRSQLGSHALEFEAGARIDYVTDQFNESIDNTRKLMNTAPGQYPDALAEQLATIDSSTLPPLKKSALRQKAIDSISQATVWSQIQRSPSGFLNSIGFETAQEGKTRKSADDLFGSTGNLAFDALPFDKRTQAFEKAIQLKSQLEGDAERATSKLQKVQEEEALKEAYDRRSKGELTRQYVEDIRPVIGSAHYKALLDMAGGKSPTHSDPDTVRNIYSAMQTDPEQAQRMAFTAHHNGMLKDEGSDGFTGIVNHAATLVRQGGPKTEYERSRQYIIGQLDPGALVRDPVQRSRLADALDTFDRWSLTGKHTDADVEKRGREVVDQFKFVNLSETILALPSPRSGHVRREPNNVAGMTQDIVAAGQAARKKLDAKEFTQAEYDSEMTILNRWRKAMNGAPNAQR